MKLNGESQTPLYQQLMEEIKRKIESGEYHYGERLPSELELIKQYAVSRITVRRAMEELVTEGYLVIRQGKGTFVNKPKIERKFKMENVLGFSNACAANGMKPSHTLVERKIITPGSDERLFFGLGDKERIIYTQRVLSADDDPIMVENNYFALKGYEFLLEEKLDGSLFDLLSQKYDIVPSNTRLCTLELVRATAQNAKLLHVPVNEPLFYMIAYITDKNDNPVYIGRQYIVGSRYMFNIP